MQRTVMAVLLLVASAGIGTGCAHTRAKGTSATSKPSLLINLTHGKSDLHAASMGLELATNALEQGSPVVVFLNVDAASLAARDLGEDVQFAGFPPISDLLRTVTAKGGKVFVCGHCAGVANVSKEDIAPGIVVVEDGDIIKALEPGMVGFSY